ncbi:tripartite tricarboxylate transporter substrate binding protein [Petroclostridium sp. X23]|uniref:tripartite tricarboxylate transporter substrate binding protein n=1 Tax=Petroclostridium sp. X23 TaxID=3045146 RepID=UPI0024AC9478|nr:tripartite tricarboxylate transporter substrate binding protein [Petroclostridium sp. X23]WHH61660.1 tripartite tricarboxylate transporter substrate binding protein [Petroclostridium sp. X23]
MLRKKRFLSLVVAVFLVFTIAGCGQQQAPRSEVKNEGTAESAPKETANKKDLNYPKKPIKFVIPWSAGGSSDLMARAFSSIAEKHLGQPLVIVNRDGAGGTIATTETKSASADGYTIIMEAVGVFSTQPKMRKVSYTLDDFDPIIGLSYEPIVLAVNNGSEFKSFEDLKNAKRSIKFGGNAVGSLLHIGGMDLFAKAGIKAEHVPFQGNAPGITALLGKHVDVVAAHPGELINHEKNGDLKIIGILSPERFHLIPDVPTFKEQGYDVDYSVWKFILTPKGVDPNITKYLNEKFNEMIKDPEFVKFCENNNLEMNPITGEEVATKLNKEITVTGEMIDNLGLTGNN